MRLSGFLFLALWSGVASAQVTQRNLLEPYAAKLSTLLIDNWHPFPKTPGEWVLADPARERLVAAGEKALGFEFRPLPATLILEYKRTGNRVHFEKVSFEKRNALWALVLAESVEGKGRFTDKILDGVWSICEESYWGLPAHLGLQKAGTGLPDVNDPTVDLFTAETAAVLAWTDYFAGAELDKLSPLVRQRIYTEVNRRVFVPLQTAKYGYLGGGRVDVRLNNWDPWVMSNYCAAALLLEKDPGRRVDAIGRAMHFTDLYINGLGEDGGCEEGPSYWTAAGACVFDVLNLLSDATQGRIDIYGAPIVRRMAAYIYETHIAGKYYIDIADAPPQFVPDGPMIFRFGRAIGDTVMEGFGSWITHTYPADPGSYEQFHRTRALYDLLAASDCDRYPPAEPKLPRVWLSDVQLMIVRDASSGLFAASHAGTNGESHNHNDVGDFMVYAGGRPVIIDVGSGTYTARTFSSHGFDLWFNTSAYHNLPTINGYQQREGMAYAATDVKCAGNVLSMDIAKAYPEAAGMRRWERVVRLEKGVSVADRYQAVAPLRELTQSFLTVCAVDASKAGRVVFDAGEGVHVTLDYDAGHWAASVEKVEFGIPEEAGVREHWEGKPVYRVLLAARGMPAAGVIRWNFHY